MMLWSIQTAQVVFLVCLLVAIVLPNSAILLSIIKSHSSVARKSRMKFFIMHLAVAGINTLSRACRLNQFNPFNISGILFDFLVIIKLSILVT